MKLLKITNLPDEIIAQIMVACGKPAAFRLSCTCHQFYDVFNSDENFWKALVAVEMNINTDVSSPSDCKPFVFYLTVFLMDALS